MADDVATAVDPAPDDTPCMRFTIKYNKYEYINKYFTRVNTELYRIGEPDRRALR